jgi:hypothetical protein
MALKSKKVVLLAKIEGTYGTDSLPTGAANAILCINPKLTPMALLSAARNVIKPYFSNDGKIIAGKNVQLTFDVEIAGAGAAGTAPQYGVLLKGCALGETINAGVSAVYAPISSAEQSVTLYYCVDGVQHKILGARGSVSLKFTQGAVPMLTFKFTGLYALPTDTVLPTPTFSATKPVAVTQANTTPVSLHGYAAALISANLDLANTMSYRNLIGLEEVTFTDRQPVASFDLERPTMALKDYFSIAALGTTGAFTMTHGTVGGNKFSVSAPAVQLGAPTLGSANGVETMTMTGDLIPTTGNDELTITVL